MSLNYGMVIAALLAGTTMACGDDTTGSGGSGGQGTGATGGGGATSTGGSGGQGTGGAATVAYVGTLTEVIPPDPPTTTTWTEVGPIEGMEICLRGEPSVPCATTAANGKATVEGLPIDSNVALTFENADFGRTVLQYVTTTVDEVHGPALAQTVDLDTYLATGGCSAPPAPGKGTLVLGLPPGASLTTTPPATVIYTGEDGLFDTTLTAVPAATPAQLASAIVCDLTPGNYQIDFAGTTGTCHMVEGWPSTGHDVEALVDADSLTVVNWICQ